MTVPALAGCTSQGVTTDEPLANAKEAVAGHVASLEQIGEPVPDETAVTIIVTNVAA